MVKRLEIRIGLLSRSRELIEDFTGNLSDYKISSYSNIDNVRHEDFSILAVDTDSFDNEDAIQFYLSKIRKKFKSLPILLILKEK